MAGIVVMKDDNDTGDLMTYAEVAGWLNVKVGTLYQMVHERRIPHVRMGGRLVRFRKVDLQRWLEMCQRLPVGGPRKSDASFARDMLAVHQTTDCRSRAMSNKNMSNPNDPELQRLRAFANRVRKMMQDENIGGSLVLVSEEAAEWLVEIPKWTGIRFESSNGVRVKTKGQKQSTSALHFVGVMRDQAADMAGVWSQLWNQVVAHIRSQGGEVDHVPFGGLGKGASGRTQN